MLGAAEVVVTVVVVICVVVVVSGVVVVADVGAGSRPSSLCEHPMAPTRSIATSGTTAIVRTADPTVHHIDVMARV
ncbi:hypothetical protein GCM10009632_05170 [Mycolicibacterium alvei]|uniref:Uncharacterized protein n=2 Tax=Mycolicibacterium alvei TaxID=67081 RepID=A0A6N4V1T5_9MYCO|nr:hypothetical protein MALV_56630 [Mycolicibacterium alvei]